MRTVSIATTLLAILVLSGCLGSTAPPPHLTDDQFQQWHERAEEMVPAATLIEIEAAEGLNTARDTRQTVAVRVSFADFAALKEHHQDAQNLAVELGNETGVRVLTHLINDDAEEFQDELSVALSESVPGLDGAYIDAQATDRYEELVATAYVFVDDPHVVAPAWLDEISSITQQAISEEGDGRIDSISVLPTRAFESGLEVEQLRQARLWVEALPNMKQAAAGTGCVRTGEWAYDLGMRWITVYSALSPGGSCEVTT